MYSFRARRKFNIIKLHKPVKTPQISPLPPLPKECFVICSGRVVDLLPGTIQPRFIALSSRVYCITNNNKQRNCYYKYPPIAEVYDRRRSFTRRGYASSNGFHSSRSVYALIVNGVKLRFIIRLSDLLANLNNTTTVNKKLITVTTVNNPPLTVNKQRLILSCLLRRSLYRARLQSVE